MAWQLDKNRATLKMESFVGSFDLSQPYLGLKFQGRDRPGDVIQLFAFLVTDSSVETYVRGVDLVNKYPPRNSDLVSYQTYYRATAAADGIEFILSAQTSLLESVPLTQVTSSFPAAELLFESNGECRKVSNSMDFDREAQPSFFLLRPNNSDEVSLGLYVHPSDFHRASVRIDPDPSIAFWVFPNSLEKGVIRQASFQLRLISRKDDETRAADLLADVVSAGPTLAT